MSKNPVPKVLLTIDVDNSLWKIARADIGAAYLPFVCREIIAGNVTEVTLPVADWSALQTFLAGLPGGREKLPYAVADAPPPVPPETSERAVAARKLAEIVTVLGAVSPYGGDVTREESGRYYAVGFSWGGMMAGQIFVYSAEYVRIAYTSQTQSLPAVDSRVFASIDIAAKFLAQCISVKDFQAALAIPLRESKRKKPGNPK